MSLYSNEITHFLPRNAMLAQYMLSSCVRPFVCPSVVHKPELYRTAKRKITQTTPHYSRVTLVC